MTWRPISEYEKSAFEGETVQLSDDDGNECVGEWGWVEEYWDGYECAWHEGDYEPLTWEPTKFRPLY